MLFDEPLNARKLYEDVAFTYNEIGYQVGMRVSPLISLNGSLFPYVLLLCLNEKDFRYFLSRDFDGSETDVKKDIEDTCRFLAENDYIIPKSMVHSSFDEYQEYVRSNEETIFLEIQSSTDRDFITYFNESFF